MGFRSVQITWVIVVLILGLFVVISLRIFLRDQNKIYAAAERAKCQAEMMKQNQTEFNICQDIFNASRENSIF